MVSEEQKKGAAVPPQEQQKRGVLERTVGRYHVEKLHAAGHLGDEARGEALRLLDGSLRWWYWADRLMLILGAALLLAGVVFFFAFNWAKMAASLKFALIEGGILACALAAWRLGIDKLGGKLSLLGASLLVGVFLAVFGQVYQTGADAYELFVGWTILVTGWVVISRFAALWIMWLTLVNTGLIFYWNQVMIRSWQDQYVMMYLILAAINTVALVFDEQGRKKKIPWLQHLWHRWALLFSVLFYLTVPSMTFIFQGRKHVTPLPLVFIVLFFVAGYRFYRLHEKDLAALALLVLSAASLILSAAARGLFHRSIGAGSFLAFALAVVLVFSGAVFWLRDTAKQIAGETHEA